VRHALQYLHRIVAGVLPPMFMAIEASRVLGALLALLSCYALLASSSVSLPSDSCLPLLYIATETTVTRCCCQRFFLFFSKMRTWWPLCM
jgi:hypothetical protein